MVCWRCFFDFIKEMLIRATKTKLFSPICKYHKWEKSTIECSRKLLNRRWDSILEKNSRIAFFCKIQETAHAQTTQMHFFNRRYILANSLRFPEKQVARGGKATKATSTKSNKHHQLQFQNSIDISNTIAENIATNGTYYSCWPLHMIRFNSCACDSGYCGLSNASRDNTSAETEVKFIATSRSKK